LKMTPDKRKLQFQESNTVLVLAQQKTFSEV